MEQASCRATITIEFNYDPKVMSRSEAIDRISQEANYSFKLREKGLRIIDTDWHDTEASDEVD